MFDHPTGRSRQIQVHARTSATARHRHGSNQQHRQVHHAFRLPGTTRTRGKSPKVRPRVRSIPHAGVLPCQHAPQRPEGMSMFEAIAARVPRVLKLEEPVHREIADDESATGQAIVVTILAALIASLTAEGNFLTRVVGALIFAPIGLFVWTGITFLLGKMFGGTASYSQLVRPIGYAAAPYALAIVPVVRPSPRGRASTRRSSGVRLRASSAPGRGRAAPRSRCRGTPARWCPGRSPGPEQSLLGLGIEVVGRLVQQEDVGPRCHQHGQRQLGLLPAGQGRHPGRPCRRGRSARAAPELLVGNPSETFLMWSKTVTPPRICSCSWA
jgi:hypothetical protein